MSLPPTTSRPSPASPGSMRDHRLDFFRGIALLFIFVDHMPRNALGLVTMRSFGFSDAAEVFVLIAGYTAMLAYGSTFERDGVLAGARRVGRRIRELYMAHLLLVTVSVIGLFVAATAFQNPIYVEHVNLTPFAYDPWGAIWRMLVLYHQLGYLNILPLYMVLLAWLPVLVWLMRRHPLLALAASVAIWLAAFTFRINLPSWPEAFGWYFDPLAWQVIFSIGAVAGHYARRGHGLPRSPWLIAGASAYVAFACLLMAPWVHIPGLADARLLPNTILGFVTKSYVSPWRLAHILALAYLVALAVPATSRWLESRPAQWVIHCGRNSLEIFCLATVFSFAGFIVLLEAGHGLGYQLLVNGIGLSVLGYTGWRLTHAKLARRKAQATAPQASGAQPAGG